jgi:predicted RNA polymerase sigma factor
VSAVFERTPRLVASTADAGRLDDARPDFLARGGEAIRIARQLSLATEEREGRGVLAVMLLNRARLSAPLDLEGRLVTRDRQDRGLCDTEPRTRVRVAARAAPAPAEPPRGFTERASLAAARRAGRTGGRNGIRSI